MTLRASGEAVGLSWGEMGNSEVGHLAVGAGRVYYQTLPRINREIEKGEFFKNQALLNAINQAKSSKGKLHLIGIISPGRVHGMDAHCHALLELAKQQGLSKVFIHAITDGRDTVYNSGIDFITTLQEKIKEIGVGQIASLSGRYFAMDRDNRWDRVEKAYNAMARATSESKTNDPIQFLRDSYTAEVYDEELPPTVVGKGATIDPGDAVIFFNFRPDRARQLTKAFVLPDFDKFERQLIDNLYFTTMVEYEKNLPVEVAYPPELIKNTLSEVIADAGLKQLHIAETEKYAHVTFFLNGTREEPFPGEDRVIIPSPQVASYDEQPEMSARELTDRVLKEIKSDKYDFIAMNFANSDMVGHTGNLEATKAAVAVVDESIGRIVEAVVQKGGVVFMTADHGNAENEVNLQTGDQDKEHSTNPVPFIIAAEQFEGQTSPSGEVPGGDLSLMPQVGMLADVAPTIIAVLGLEQPADMTGQNLL